jgi:hypothetical protein
MNLWAAVRRLLVTLAVIGMISSTFALPVVADASHSSSGMSHKMGMPCDRAMPMNNDQGTSEKGQTCPYIAFCLAKCFQNIPEPAAIVARPITLSIPVALRIEQAHDGVISAPPSRPPRS